MPDLYNNWELLVGKTVTAVWIDGSEQHYLRFDTDVGRFWATAQGDCCSESWFSHVSGLAALIGSPIIEVVEREMPEAPQDGKCRQEEDSLYGYGLRTAQGVCDIDFRNSSNGYYGGWAEVSKRMKIEPEAHMRLLTEDYDA